MDLKTIAGWPVEDQVTFLVGRASRVAVDLEVAVRSLLRALPGAPVNEKEGFSALVRDTCRLACEALSEDPVTQQFAKEALDQAKATHARRSRMVHDVLVADMGETVYQYRTTLREVEAEPETPRYREKSVPELRSVCLELLEVTWRVRGLAQYFLAPEQRMLWENVVKGEATVDWDGNSHWVGPVEAVPVRGSLGLS